jgi:hypothetical protein
LTQSRHDARLDQCLLLGEEPTLKKAAAMVAADGMIARLKNLVNTERMGVWAIENEWDFDR